MMEQTRLICQRCRPPRCSSLKIRLLPMAFVTVFALLHAIAIVKAEETADVASQYVDAMVQWLRSESGYYNDKLRIRRADPSDPNSYFGMFATTDVDEGERLLFFPSDYLIKVNETLSYEDGLCALASKLRNEMELGNESDYAPYINYVKTQRKGQIPPAFSKEGTNLLGRITGHGHDLDEDGYPASVLPPISLITFLETDCVDTPEEQHAMAVVIQRGFDHILVPIYDMINHNNAALNTNNTNIYDEEGFTVYASKPIKANEEIFCTYDRCLNCDGVEEHWGTPEIFRDFGFVEAYPQRWHFEKQNIAFDLFERDASNGSFPFKVVWDKLLKPKDEHQVESLEEEYQRVDDIYRFEIRDDQKETTIPHHEWSVIVQYTEALMTAMKMAIQTAREGDESTCTGKSCFPEPNWTDVAIEDLDENYQKIYQCENVPENFDYVYDEETGTNNAYVELETIQSDRRKIQFYEHESNKNICYFLNEIPKKCSSFKLHYDEMFVHKTAKFAMGSIKRVVLVGGGDAGLLNEILKYQAVESVVVLELDQKLTRSTYKYFGSNPHFDNEKVQWWFGDLSKSLLMLPTEYFGTFDMVLMDDMSYTFSSDNMSVLPAKEHNFISLVSRLLNADGIFAAPGFHFYPTSQVFRHTINYFFSDVPDICDQAFVMATNGVDFLHREIREHNLKNLLVERSIYRTKYLFDMIHDYRRNNDNTDKLLPNNHHLLERGNTDKQTASQGILMIVEAENVSADLGLINDVKTSVTYALSKLGFEVLVASDFPPSKLAYSEATSNFALVLKEGYVVVRAFPGHRYVSFDIHLWSAFGKHEAARNALVASVGGTIDSVTSYRIVAGGMFGVSNWKDDRKSRGPKDTSIGEENTPQARGSFQTDPNFTEIAIKAGMSLMREKIAEVLVICGYKTEPCSDIDLLEKDDNIKKVVPLYTCPELMADEQSFDDRQDRFFDCRESILKALNASFDGEDRKLSAIVLDKSAPKEMGTILGQILLKLFHNYTEAPRGVLSDQWLMLALVEEESEGWRRKLLDIVREELAVTRPIFGSRLFLNSSDSSIEMHVASFGDELFFDHLVEMVSTVERENDLSLEIRNVLGGYWRSKKKYSISKADGLGYFLFEVLKQEHSLQQLKSQQALGHQSLFQLKQGTRYDVGNIVLANYKGKGFLTATVVEVDYVDDLYGVKFGHGENLKLSISDLRSRPTPRQAFPTISSGMISNALRNALAEISNQIITEEYVYDVGDGSVLVALWPEGTIVMGWDGRNQVDINLFTYMESREFASKFISSFKESAGNLTLFSRDEQPRGTGRVVNFSKDISAHMDLLQSE